MILNQVCGVYNHAAFKPLRKTAETGKLVVQSLLELLHGNESEHDAPESPEPQAITDEHTIPASVSAIKGEVEPVDPSFEPSTESAAATVAAAERGSAAAQPSAPRQQSGRNQCSR